MEEALRLFGLGLCVIPIRLDGSKGPTIPWKNYIDHRPTEEEVRRWFAKPQGIAQICGPVSGGTCVIDFEDKELYKIWQSWAEEAMPEYREKTCVVSTPRGFHVYCKVDYVQKGGKLAQDELGKTLIEVKGYGGYTILPGSPKEVHPSGIPYRNEENDFSDLEPMSEADFGLLKNIARSFNKHKKKSPLDNADIQKLPEQDDRVGTSYSLNGDWNELLTKHKWSLLRTAGDGKEIWQRPGKQDRGGSATLGFVNTPLGRELYVFSTNAPPFEPDRCYSLLSARCILDFNGDFAATIATLVREGFGVKASGDTLARVSKAVEHVRELIKLGEDTIDEIHLAGWLRESSFKALWEMKREKDFGSDIQRYDTSIVSWLLRFNSNPKTLYNLIIGTLYAFHKKWNTELALTLSVDYIARKIDFIERNRSKKTDEEIHGAFMVAECEGDRKKMLEKLRKNLDCEEIAEVVQNGGDEENATVLFNLKNGKQIFLGNWKAICDFNEFDRKMLAADVLDTRWSSIPLKFQKRATWRNNVVVLMQALKRVEAPELNRLDQIRELVSDYLKASTIYSEALEEGWEGALDTRSPFLRGGYIWFHGGKFIQFCSELRFCKLTIQEVAPYLRAVGCHPARATPFIRYWRSEEGNPQITFEKEEANVDQSDVG